MAHPELPNRLEGRGVTSSCRTVTGVQGFGGARPNGSLTSHTREQDQSSGNPPGMVPRLNIGYQPTTRIHDGPASHRYTSDTPSKPLHNQVDSQGLVPTLGRARFSILNYRP